MSKEPSIDSSSAVSSRFDTKAAAVAGQQAGSDNVATGDPKLSKLNDNRPTGEWTSIYSWGARFSIYVELVYLIVLLFLTLFVIATCAASRLPEGAVPLLKARPFGAEENVLYWTSIGSAGVLGGTIMTLKWHYHCVAKKLWHADRRVWRITTPLISGVIALFVIMLMTSGLLPIFSIEQVTRPIGGLALSFLVGLFSDNILAALQNFALRAFGTLRDTGPSAKRPDSGSVNEDR